MSAIQDLYQASREKDSKGIDGNDKPTQCFSVRKSKTALTIMFIMANGAILILRGLTGS
jgi:hypothetical protein